MSQDTRINFSLLSPREIENLVDIGLRHRAGKKPPDYLKHWLYIARHFAYATRDDSWGELEKEWRLYTLQRYTQELRPEPTGRHDAVAR